MALSIGNITTDSAFRSGLTGASTTIAHNNNGNLLLVGVHVAYESGGVPVSMMYNGVAMTKLDNQGAASHSVHLWYLVSPASGSNNLVVTYPNTGNKEGGLAFTIVSVIDADTATPFGSVVKTGTTGTTPSVSATSASGELVIDFLTTSQAASANTITVGADQTERANYTSGSSALHPRAGCSTEPGAASVTMSWTISASVQYAFLAVPIKPAAAGGGAEGAARYYYNRMMGV